MARNINHTNLSDEELLEAWRAYGDNRYMGFLLQRYTALLLGVALKYLKDRSLAEDAVQQVFEKALKHLPKDEILNFKGWLYVLTRNHCLQQLRDKPPMADEAALAYFPAPETDQEEKLPLYGRAGIPEVWIVNLNELLIEIYREPNFTGYGSKTIARTNDQVSPQAFPDMVLNVAELLKR